MYTQLPLDLQLKDSFSFVNLVAGQNQTLLDLLQSSAAQDEQQILIWGIHNSGKTHLLQALCQLLDQQGQSFSYLPLRQMIDYSPQVFDGMETMDVCCVDDVQMLEHKADWQEAMFDLINRMREQGKRLLITSRQPPADLQLTLKDLVSRLQWGPVFRLHEMSDEEKCEALQLRASGRGFELAENVATYLLNYYNRDIADLFDMLETLDRAQLAHQRRLTIPFVKQVLGNNKF